MLKAVIKTSLLYVRRDLHYEISLTLVDDATIRQLNKAYRKLDRPTDVLSFALEEGDSLPMPNEVLPLLGEITISVPRAKAQAVEYGHSFEREMAFLTAHGMLHLLGYDHQTELDTKRMENLQRKILDTLQITR